MEYCILPMWYNRITQLPYSNYSHKGSTAMDMGGKDTGQDIIFAPCTMVIKRIRSNANGEVYLESLEKVCFADGSINYLRMLLIHCDNRHLKVGQIFKQFDSIVKEGGWGSGKSNKFANHIHIEVGKGKWISTTQSVNNYGTRVIENQSHPKDIFYVTSNHTIHNNTSNIFKTLEIKEDLSLNLCTSLISDADVFEISKLLENLKINFEINNVIIIDEISGGDKEKLLNKLNDKMIEYEVIDYGN